MQLEEVTTYPDEESQVYYKSRYVTKNQAQNSADNTRGSEIKVYLQIPQTWRQYGFSKQKKAGTKQSIMRRWLRYLHVVESDMILGFHNLT